MQHAQVICNSGRSLEDQWKCGKETYLKAKDEDCLEMCFAWIQSYVRRVAAPDHTRQLLGKS